MAYRPGPDSTREAVANKGVANGYAGLDPNTRVRAAQMPLAPFGGAIINGLGDSITAQSVYQASNVPDSRFPTWTAGTSYVTGQCVQSGGLAFYCSTAGASASAGTGPSVSALTDGTVTWGYLGTTSSKNGAQGGFLSWASIFSLGALVFDLTLGYGGFANTLRKVMVVTGGNNYTSPTVTFSQGAAGTATVVGGVITAVAVTNPGYGLSSFTASISDSTGYGAVLSLVKDGSGTFGSFGCTTADMAARLPDCVASKACIFTVLGGHNDLVNNSSFGTIAANLRICYETLMDSGKAVIAIPILPSAGLSTGQSQTLTRVNHWIRAYCQGLSWANPTGYTRIALADAGGLWVDGTNLAAIQPIGGTGGTASSVTFDGTHPSARGAMYLGYVVWQAAQKFVGPQQGTVGRPYHAFDGYDAVNNPGGNLLEGLPWAASSTYAVGQLRSNSGSIYSVKAITTGMSAASGGPTGTTSTITDAGVTWQYVRPVGLSVLGSGTGGTNTPTSGITFSGSLAGGLTLIRTSGSASGTIAESIETPWTDGHAGQRQVVSFSLGGGTPIEVWALRVMYGSPFLYGITSADFGTSLFFAEVEVEISGIGNVCGLYLDGPFDNNVGLHSYCGSTGAGTGYRLAGAAGDPIGIPNGGRMLLTSAPTLLPGNIVNFCFALNFALDTSGSSGSATLTAKINYLGLRRAGMA